MESVCKDGEKARLMEVHIASSRARGDNPGECPVCMTPFDDVVQRPRTLPCGHTFCTSCINGLKQQGRVTCPNCRTVHGVPDVGQFPISYITESFIKRLTGAELASLPSKGVKDLGEPSPPPVEMSDRRRSVCLSSAIRSMLQEQEEKVLATIRGCKELQWQLDHYQTTLEVWGEQQQHLEDRLQAFVDRSKSSRVLVRQEQSQVGGKKEQVHQGEQQQHNMLHTLRSVTSRQEAFEAIDDADQLADEERQRTEEWQATFPATHTVTAIRKIRVASRAALKAVQTIEAALDTRNTVDTKDTKDVEDTKDAVDTAKTEGASADVEGEAEPPAAPPSTIMGRLEVLLAPTLEAEDLRLMMPPTRSLLETGRVFATHEVEGQSCHARITLEEDRLYLHYLQHESPPPKAAILQVEDLVPAVPPCLTFLDLKWPDSEPRRVFIRLSPDTTLGRQFILLCTGQRGPCYVNTLLFQVKYHGQPGERVSGGDYERNNGKGGAPLLSDLDTGEYHESRQAGAVYPVWRGGYKTKGNSRFGILTKDLEKEGSAVNSVFGEVEAGFEVVTEAAQHSPITDVTVVDCGVVLWE